MSGYLGGERWALLGEAKEKEKGREEGNKIKIK